jgi:hypothetical protein
MKTKNKLEVFNTEICDLCDGDRLIYSNGNWINYPNNLIGLRKIKIKKIYKILK